MQLTSDAARVDAHRFYERLGYARSHVGFKLRIPAARSRADQPSADRIASSTDRAAVGPVLR
ncbi:hypothetical protein BC477_09980 [Clavibacter michiganensis subsp. michiganensis]|uniref:GNAT family N-acetyltransferase n=1 Tax=Clavibacter michiganensis subsp. michiganensis TaxID=33013 RepID=A0A251XNL0_CLAMM|nr:hypothetical protein BC477_09980 [Clavibacter michiganensis subsp. michiganensis]OUE05055.1 hypothetical protein CMMCAS07_08900 [Clavibacter michiganensis subsp. michiganensis]